MSAQVYAGRSRIGGLALLEEPGNVCGLRVESWFPQPADVVIDFCLQRQNFIAIMPDPMQVIWSSTETGELGGRRTSLRGPTRLQELATGFKSTSMSWIQPSCQPSIAPTLEGLTLTN